MKQTVFERSLFKWILVAILCLFLLGDIYKMISSQQLLGLVPAGIKLLVLALIFLKNRFTYLAVKLWIALTMIANPLVMAIGILADTGATGGEESFNALLLRLGLLVLGSILLFFTYKTVSVRELQT